MLKLGSGWVGALGWGKQTTGAQCADVEIAYLLRVWCNALSVRTASRCLTRGWQARPSCPGLVSNDGLEIDMLRFITRNAFDERKRG